MLKGSELALLRAQLESCEKFKLASILEALLAGHPELVSEVKQMLEPDPGVVTRPENL